MKNLPLPTALIVALILLTGCGEMSPEEAREELAERGLSVSEENFGEQAYRGNLEAVELFLTSGMDPSAENGFIGTVLESAIYGGHADVVEALIEAGANTNVRNERGRTLLMLAARQGHAAVVQALLDAGTDPNATNNSDQTALTIASEEDSGGSDEPLDKLDKDRAEVARVLLAAGADPNWTDEFNWTPLMRASDAGFFQFVSVLLQNGADPNANGGAALMEAVEEDQPRIARLLLEEGANMPSGDQGKIALMWATRMGHVEIVRLLREARAR